MNKDKHIVFVSPGFPDNDDDTRCIPAMHLFLQELSKREGYDIQVIATDYPYQAREYVWNGIKVFALGGNNKKGLGKLKMLMSLKKKLQEIESNKKIDFLHNFWLNQSSELTARFALKNNIKHSCTLMGQEVLSKRLKKQAHKTCGLISLSQFQKELAKRNWDLNIYTTIPWGIEQLNIQHKRELEIDLIAVGNLIALKQHKLFIDVVNNIIQEYPKLVAKIIGSGPDLPELKEKVNQLGLSQNISFLGHMNREQCLAYVSKSKVFLHCSNFESFGLSLLEAQALGAHIVSTSVGIAQELDSVHLYSTKEEAVSKILKLLDAEMPSPSVKKEFLVDKTVDAYLNQVF